MNVCPIRVGTAECNSVRTVRLWRDRNLRPGKNHLRPGKNTVRELCQVKFRLTKVISDPEAVQAGTGRHAAGPARHAGALNLFASCVKLPDYSSARLDIGRCRSNNKVWRIQPQEFDEERGYSRISTCVRSFRLCRPGRESTLSEHGPLTFTERSLARLEFCRAAATPGPEH